MPPSEFIPFSRRSFLKSGSLAAAAALVLPRSLRAAGEGRKLGVALVGLGSYSTYQLGPALKETAHCQLAGVVTGDQAKGKRWAQEYGFPESSVYGYDSMDRMAENDAIDIVYVVTPNALHAEHSIKAAMAGKHVICEKPFTVSVSEAVAVMEACQKQGVKLSIGYRLHFDPYHEVLRKLAATRHYGPFQEMNGNFSFVMDRPQWRAQHALAGGGPLMDLGVYVIQEALMAKAEVPPIAVTAQALPKQRPKFFADVEETLEWTMEWADGAVLQGRTSYNDRGNRFEASAAKGWCRIGPAFGYGGIRLFTPEGEIQYPPFNQQAAQMDDFALCVKEDRESKVSGAMGLRDMVIVEAIYDAMRSGRRVLVDLI